MARLLVILPFLILAVDVFALVDVILADQRRVRALNKISWVLIILFLPLLGAILWFTIGKEHHDGADQRRTVAPDDDPSFLKNIRRDEEQDERIRRLEQELADLDDDQPKE